MVLLRWLLRIWLRLMTTIETSTATALAKEAGAVERTRDSEKLVGNVVKGASFGFIAG